MTETVAAKPLWQPNPATVGDTRMAQLMQATGHGSYADLWQWSVDQPETFWSTIWRFCGAVGEPGSVVLADGDKMPGARWFPEAKLNFAENQLQQRDEAAQGVYLGKCRIRSKRANLTPVESP